MTKEQKFYKTLQDVFIGAKIEGQGGFVNLMKIKSNYYQKIEKFLKDDIEKALEKYPSFREELFDKLYNFFSRYFTESGSIYFSSTPFHNNIYEKVYTDEKDVILFWKTQMLYYVKTDRIFKSMPVEFDNYRFYFDASTIENKKANEKRSLIYELNQIKEDQIIVFNVYYSEKGRVTKTEDILKELKKKNIKIDEEQLERAFRIFEKQSEVDFFINKNAKAFLQEQFKLWSYQYFWEGAKEWTADRVNELQILKDIAFKIIDFISQFEDELVKIWNKPKFVKNSNYVITLDRIYKNSPSMKGWQAKPDGVVKWYDLPFNPELKERAKELRKAGNLSEVLLWQQLKNKQLLGLDFDRQKIIGNYIVDLYCKNLGVVIEIDGASHNDKIEYDKVRDEYLKSLGLRVIHISDLDVKKNLEGVMAYLKSELTNTPSANADTPLQEGNLLEKILNHTNINEQIKEWQELGIVEENFKVDKIFENDLAGKHLAKKYEHLPIDTKYFKDLEFEILSQFEDLDNSLDGWLIKSENYQALNTILPKFKEKVQTIYIDPPFNTGEDFDYVDKFQDSNWLSLIENRLSLGKDFINQKGSFFLHLDYRANFLGRQLLAEIFGEDNLINEIIYAYRIQGILQQGFPRKHDTIFFYAKDADKLFFKPIKERVYYEKPFFNPAVDEQGRYYADVFIRDVWDHDETKPLISGSKEFQDFRTQKSEGLLKRIIETTTDLDDLVMDFFLGSGTTTAVAHKLGRKWIGVEMGEHFHTVVLPRMKKVLAYDKSGISKELKTPRQTSSDTPLQEGNYQGGGFFKYYELEQYEETLANTVYENHDMYIAGNKSVYEQYAFLKDEKMLKALEIDYENNKVKVDLSKLYANIDIAETLSNLTGKWIKKIKPDEVEFEDGTVLNTKDLDYKLIKPLIWWE